MGNVDRQDRQVNQGAQNQLGEARDFQITQSERGFSLDHKRSMENQGLLARNEDSCWAKYMDTTRWKEPFRLSLFLGGGRLTITQQPAGFLVEMDGLQMVENLMDELGHPQRALDEGIG